MKSILQKISITLAKRKFKKEGIRTTSRKLAKEARLFRVNLWHKAHDTFFIIISIFSAGFGLKGFLLPNNFIDGGAMGISLLISETTLISLSLLVVAVNLPFIVLGYFHIGHRFAIKSILAILGLAVILYLVPYPLITSDKLLIAVFGGFFLGAGIGLAIRGGAVIDGTEVLAIYLSKKTGLTIGDIILLFNVLIFLAGAYILSIEVALYAMLTYFAASRTVDFVIEGVEEYTGITIISKESEKLRLMITENLGRGVTIYKGKGGYGKNGAQLREQDILYTIVTRLEIARIETEIDKIDTDAFVFMQSIKDTKGGMI
nr:YitT family protein [Flavobacteriaceae bacterium]